MSARRASATRREPASTSERVRADFPILASRSTASRSSTSTTPRPRRSRGRYRRAGPLLRARTTPTSTAACTTCRERATTAYEDARETVRALHQRRATRARSSSPAARPRRSTWSRSRYGRTYVAPGDEVLITAHGAPLEHRALADALRGDGRDAARGPDRRRAATCISTSSSALLTPRTRLVAVTHVSNALGHGQPDRADHRDARTRTASPVLVDGAQWVPHLPVDVQALGCDFYAFTGHKLYGPTGIGVLYGQGASCSRRCRRGRAAGT